MTSASNWSSSAELYLYLSSVKSCLTRSSSCVENTKRGIAIPQPRHFRRQSHRRFLCLKGVFGPTHFMNRYTLVESDRANASKTRSVRSRGPEWAPQNQDEQIAESQNSCREPAELPPLWPDYDTSRAHPVLRKVGESNSPHLPAGPTELHLRAR